MNRTIKILLAFSCLILGCALTQIAHNMLTPKTEWFNPVAESLGFVLFMAAGLYSFLKIVRPLIY
jgi:hypothetical protein